MPEDHSLWPIPQGGDLRREWESIPWNHEPLGFVPPWQRQRRTMWGYGERLCNLSHLPP